MDARLTFGRGEQALHLTVAYRALQQDSEVRPCGPTWQLIVCGGRRCARSAGLTRPYCSKLRHHTASLVTRQFTMWVNVTNSPRRS